MQNIQAWKPTKFQFRRGKWRASSNASEVGISSRLVANIIAENYERSLKEHARGKLLDLGCGNVPLYACYKDYIEDNWCVDWDNSLHSNQFLDQIADLNQPLEMDDNQFDTIILSSVLEHIRKPELLISEMSRILKPGGKALLNQPFMYWLHEVPHDYYRYTEYALKSMLEDHGFELISIEPYGGVPEVLTDIWAKTTAAIPFVGKPYAAFIQWCTLVFVRTRFGKKISKKTARKIPLGYFVVAQKKK